MKYSEKYEKFKLLLEDYEFYPSILLESEFKDCLKSNVEMKIVHKHCKSEIYSSLNSFLIKRNPLLDKFKVNLNKESSIMCPHCVQESKNEYIRKLIKEKSNDTFILKSDYLNMNEYVVLEHKSCKQPLEIKAVNLERAKTELRCTYCTNLLSRSEKTKQKEIEQLKDRFDFSEDISDKFIFKKYLDKELDIYHKECKTTMRMTLNYFLEINKGSFLYLHKYVSDIKDLKCPHCKQEAKNKYFNELLEIKTNGMFELSQNFNILGEKVKIRHKLCKEEMEIWGTSITSDKTVVRCSSCARLLTSSERAKQHNFINAMEYFEFPFDIKQPYLFKNNLENTVEIKHKTCQRTFEIEFGKFNSATLGNIEYISKYIDNALDVKCPHCLQDAKNKYFQEILLKDYKGFSLVGNYMSAKDEVTIYHEECQQSFKVRAENILRGRTVICENCKDENSSYKKELQKKRNKEFRKKLRAKDLKEFKLVGNYIDSKTEITLVHKECGYEFEVSPDNFFKRVNKCPNCTGNRRVIYKDQDEKNKVFQERLNLEVEGFKLVGDFHARVEEVTLYHEECKKEFTEKYDYFIDAGYKCPHCQSDRYKNGKNITIKEKIKLFEKDLGGEYKILTGFVVQSDEVTIKHIKCGKTFEKKLSNALKTKSTSILCPYCRMENKKNQFLEKLYNKFGDAYKLIGEYKGQGELTEFKHNGCGETFLIEPKRLLEKVLESCPNCNEKNELEKRIKVFKNKLYEKHKASYEMVGKYNGFDKKILFRHRECKELFWETPYNMLNKDIPCPKCKPNSKNVTFDEAKERIRRYNGDMYSIVGKYVNTETKTWIRCYKCDKEFLMEPVKLFKRRVCPNCGKKHTE